MPPPPIPQAASDAFPPSPSCPAMPYLGTPIKFTGPSRIHTAKCISTGWAGGGGFCGGGGGSGGGTSGCGCSSQSPASPTPPRVFTPELALAAANGAGGGDGSCSCCCSSQSPISPPKIFTPELAIAAADGSGGGDCSCGCSGGVTTDPSPLSPSNEVSICTSVDAPPGMSPVYHANGGGDALASATAANMLVSRYAPSPAVPIPAGSVGATFRVNAQAGNLVVQMAPPAGGTMDPLPVFTYNSAALIASPLGTGWIETYQRQAQDSACFGRRQYHVWYGHGLPARATHNGARLVQSAHHDAEHGLSGQRRLLGIPGGLPAVPLQHQRPVAVSPGPHRDSLDSHPRQRRQGAAHHRSVPALDQLCLRWLQQHPPHPGPGWSHHQLRCELQCELGAGADAGRHDQQHGV